MNNKFELSTFIDYKHKTFMEYEDIENFIFNEGENGLDTVYGYFKPRSNILLSEINKNRPDISWVVCYIDGDGTHQLETFQTTFDMKVELDDIISKCDSEYYVNLYRLIDLITL